MKAQSSRGVFFPFVNRLELEVSCQFLGQDPGGMILVAFASLFPRAELLRGV
jgi:hypothetical protein